MDRTPEPPTGLQQRLPDLSSGPDKSGPTGFQSQSTD
jgi:hypothetical protein